MTSIGPILVGPDWPAGCGRTKLSQAEPVQHAALRLCLVEEMAHTLAGLEPRMIPVEDWEWLLKQARQALSCRSRRRGKRIAPSQALKLGVYLAAHYVCRHRIFFDDTIYDRAIGVLAARRARPSGGSPPPAGQWP
jgi:hypothetical protein